MKSLKLIIPSITIISILLIALNIYGQKEKVIKCDINFKTYDKVYLVSIYGAKNTPIDSVKLEGSSFSFNLKKEYNTGMYRLLFTESDYVNFIYNNESIELKLDGGIEVENIEVIESEENDVYYTYLQNSKELNTKIQETISQAKLVYNNKDKKSQKELDSLKIKIKFLETAKRELALELANKFDNLFISKILKGMQVPDYYKYIEQNPETSYADEFDFLRIHYFDYLELTDTNLLHTDVVYLSFSTYLKHFAWPVSTEGYIRAIDMMLAKASESPESFHYVLKLLIKTFEGTKWNNVYDYLTDNYLSKDSVWNKQIIEKAEIVKKLTPGNIAPQILSTEVSGEKIDLHKLNASALMIVFWSADCDHCMQDMPKVKKSMDKHIANGLQVVTISIDVDQILWRDALKELNIIDWHNIIAPEGIESKILRDYNVSVTPTFYLLDSEKKIVKSTFDLLEIEKNLEKLLNE